MFDYSTLKDQVRRLLGDGKELKIEETASFQNSSYYITLAEEGYAEISDGGIIINDQVLAVSDYTVTKNIIKFREIIETGSSVSIEYSISKYTDEMIVQYIGDTITNYIQALVNIDYQFSGTTTEHLITHNDISLFVHGTVLNLAGINIMEVAGDAIYIKDGDTTINTEVASKQALTSYKSIFEKFIMVLRAVRNNTFDGEAIRS